MISVYQAKDHRWRDSYNPLRGLNMCRLVSMLEAGERGQYADLQWFYYFMERSDAMIASVIQRRRAALLSVDWDIRVAAGGEDCRPQTADRRLSNAARGDARPPVRGKMVDAGLAEEQRDFLRMVYDGIENFKDAVGFLWSGVFRGYAHLEKHFSSSGLIERLEPVEQWFWVRDGMFNQCRVPVPMRCR